MDKEKDKTNEIVIYNDSDGPAIAVNFDGETLWLTQQQIANLFGVNTPAINKHINNIYKEAELKDKATISKMEIVQKEGKREVTRVVWRYNLDMIISVGYRVNSTRATKFRIWATQRLRDYLLKGYAINKDKLKDKNLSKVKELQSAIQVIQSAIQQKKLEGYEKEILDIITEYASTWTALYQYDEDKLGIEKGTKKIVWALDHEKISKSIIRFRERLIKEKQASNLFGKEVGEKLKALLGNIEQTYDGRALYQSLEEKAAHLLYFAIKDHPFADGNKRIGALMFMLYLIENNRIYNKRGERIINDNALTALALLIAESKPDQKEVMVNLVASLLVKK